MTLHKLILALSLFGCHMATSSAQAQTINMVHVYTEPAGLHFRVDGQDFFNAGDFPWPANSKHVVTGLDQENTQYGARFKYLGSITNLGPVADLAITADPALRWIKLTFSTDYLLTVNLLTCTATPCFIPGRVVVNGQVYEQFSRFYVPANTQIDAAAYPSDGYIFSGWGRVNSATGSPTPFAIHFSMTEPSQLAPTFDPAASTNAKVNIQSDPPQLALLLDRTSYTGPVTLDWGLGTVHSLGALPVQNDHGTFYVFDSWSDGGPINHDIQVPRQPGSLNYVAKFVPGTQVQFITSPPGLSLSVDGRQNYLNYGFVWAPGTTHQIAAPATQTDAQGHKYRFVSWSNGKPASFDFTVTKDAGTITALYEAVGQAVVTSVPAGINLQIDGAPCTTPCTLERSVGSAVRITAPDTLDSGDGSRILFNGWDDGGSPARTVTLTADKAVYTAQFRRQVRLTLSSNPPDGADIQASPTSPDGFYDSGTTVAVSASIKTGFRMLNWSGDLTGKSTGGVLMLDAPRSASLQLQSIPAIADRGVRNAASDAPGTSVAPGSLISIFGIHLASDLLVGPVNPLAQTLGNVTVRVDGNFLPLLFVSPAQINAQLISGLDPGPHTLIVRVEGKEETSIQFSVARNAPGLFTTDVKDQKVGVFVRQNGEAVTPDHPAQAGETVTLLGTGLGPYQPAAADGFVIGESAGYSLVDPIDLSAEDAPLSVIYAGPANAGAGIDAVRFKVPATLPPSGYVRIQLKVNGAASNPVSLPVPAAPSGSAASTGTAGDQQLDR